MIEWVAACLSLTGILLNAKKIIWCWPVWVASNVAWISYGLYVGEWAVLVTFGGFLAGNVYGWIEWHGHHEYGLDWKYIKNEYLLLGGNPKVVTWGHGDMLKCTECGDIVSTVTHTCNTSETE